MIGHINTVFGIFYVIGIILSIFYVIFIYLFIYFFLSFFFFYVIGIFCVKGHIKTVYIKNQANCLFFASTTLLLVTLYISWPEL